MELNKYIPGDLAMINGDIVKIMAVCFNYNLNIIQNYDVMFPNGNIYKYEAESLKELPLTQEILEKNGWEKSKIYDCAYFYYKDGLFLTYTSKDGKFWFDDFDYSSSICVELPYVHSLQHLLFGLGINHEMEV